MTMSSAPATSSASSDSAASASASASSSSAPFQWSPVKEEAMGRMAQERHRLQEQEIQSCCTGVPAAVYHRLLLLHLCLDEVTDAKFLWQRIPAETKETHADLGRLWTVGKHLVERNPPAAFKALTTDGWNVVTTKDIELLRDCIRTRNLSAVGSAYSSVSVSDFSQYVGLPEPEAVALVEQQEPAGEWSVDIDAGMVHPPARKADKAVDAAGVDEKLQKLTDFIGFLEKQ